MTIDSVSYKDLLHYKIQAAMKKYKFNDFSYVGVLNGEHTYNICGNIVPVTSIEDFDLVD